MSNQLYSGHGTSSPFGFKQKFRRRELITNPIAGLLFTDLNLCFDPAVSPVARLDPHNFLSTVGSFDVNNNATHCLAVEIVVERHTLRTSHQGTLKSCFISWTAIPRMYINVMAVSYDNEMIAQTFSGLKALHLIIAVALPKINIYQTKIRKQNIVIYRWRADLVLFEI